jgi:biotin carboxylase
MSLGEITGRIIKAARKFGIETVAAFSAADTGAMLCEMADTPVSAPRHLRIACSKPEPSQQTGYVFRYRAFELCRTLSLTSLGPYVTS